MPLLGSEDRFSVNEVTIGDAVPIAPGGYQCPKAVREFVSPCRRVEHIGAASLRVRSLQVGEDSDRMKRPESVPFDTRKRQAIFRGRRFGRIHFP